MVKHKQVRNLTHFSEPQLVQKLQQRAKVLQSSGVVLGIGDDCAIVRSPGAAEDLLYTTDMLIEGVHFRRETHSPADAGWKALARGLSDIAAMGGEPRFFLASLAITERETTRWIDGFYSGLLRLAAQAGVSLIGGDLAKTDRLFCDIVVAGTVPRGKALRRDGARAGDAIYVSGALGGSALGLEKGKGQAWAKHKKPTPRITLGRLIRETIRATAAMDLSDGLSLDLHRLCAASRLSAEITMPPVFPGASLEQALHGGEDYELLFTTGPGTRVPKQLEGVSLTRIGTMRSGKFGQVVLEGTVLSPAGFDHLRR